MAEVTLTISAEDGASSVLAKVSQGLDKLSKGSEQAGASTRKVGEEAKTTGKSFDQFASAINTAAADLKSMLTPANLLGSVIGVGMVMALRGAISETRNYAMEMQRLTLVTGASLSEIGELQDAASKLGVGAGTLQRAFFLLSSEIESGGRNLAKLGISIRDVSGAQRGDIELLKLMSIEFRKMSSATEQAVAAKKAFGRSAVSLLPLLTLTEQQIEELGESGREFNKRFGEEGVRSAIRLGGAVDEVHEAFSRMHMTMVQDLAPGIKLLADNFSRLVDVVWHIPQPIRLIGETLIAMTLVLGGAAIAIKALAGGFATLFVALKLEALAGIAAAFAAWAVPIGIILAALTALFILGPQIKNFFSDMIPEGVITKWERFKDAVGVTWEKLKGLVSDMRLKSPISNFPDEGARALARVGAPVGEAADREQTLAELQIEMGLKHRLLQTEMALIKATHDGTTAQLFASKVKQQMAEDEIELELKKLSDRKDADQQIKDQRKTLEQALTNIRKTGGAERLQIIRQQAIEEINLAKSVASAVITTHTFGEDAIRLRTALEIESAKKIYDLSLKTAEDRKKLDAATTIAKQNEIQQLQQLDQQRLQISLATNTAILGQEAEQRKTTLDLARNQVEEELRISDSLASRQLIQTEEHIQAQIHAAGRLLAIRLAELGEEDTAIAQQLQRDLEANAQSLQDATDKSLKETQIVQEAALKYESIQRQRVVVVSNTQNQIAGITRDKEIKALEDSNKAWAFASQQIAEYASAVSKDIQPSVEETERLTKAQVELGRLTPIEALFQQRNALLQSIAHMKGLAQEVYLTGVEHRELAIRIAESEVKLKSLNQELSLTGQLQKVFSGLTDIFSMFGIKLSKFIIMLQGIPRAISGFREVFAGLGGLMTLLSGTSLGAGAAWAETAKSVAALGNASGETAGVLGFFSGTLNAAIRILSMFGNGLLGIFNFFGQIVQGIASGGGIVNTLTSAFGGLVKEGGALFSTWSALTSVASNIYTSFATTILPYVAQGLSSLGFQAASTALLEYTANLIAANAAMTGGAAAGSAAAGGLSGAVSAAWPVAVAISAVQTLMTFIRGDFQLGIQQAFKGAMWPMIMDKLGTLGKIVDWGMSAALGFADKIVEGLFRVFGLISTPKAKLSASITPFDRHAMGAEIIGAGGLLGTQVGAGLVNISGNIMKNKKERALQETLAAMINELLIHVVDATVLMIKTLPPSIGAQLDAALTDLEATGLEIVDKKWKGGKAGKKFSKRVKGLMEETLQDLVTALDFGDVNLKALGFDPKDPKGKKGGEMARGFEAMMVSLGAFSAIVKAAGNAVDFSTVSLAEFTAGSIKYFQGFAKEGETFIDTINRVMESIGGIIQMREQIQATITKMSGNVSEAFGLMADLLVTLHDRTVAAADALTVAAESGASPEEVLKAAQATQQALEAETQGVQTLKAAIDAMNASILTSVGFIVDLTQRIDSLRGIELSTSDFDYGVSWLVDLFNQLTDVTSRIAIFAAGVRGMSENLTLFTDNIPLVVQGFNLIMEQIRAMTNPQQAMNALQGLAEAVNAGLQALISAVQRQTQERIAGLEAEKVAIQALFKTQQTALEAQRDLITENYDRQRTALEEQRDLVVSAAKEQRTALEAQRDLITENYDAQRGALQEQLRLAQEWSNVLQSVEGQLVDLFNLLAPTHPEASFNDVLAQFRATFTDFQASPTAEGATKVQDLIRQVLQLAQGVPGMDLPSAAFQALAAEMKTAMETIAAVAKGQPSQEAIQAQLVALEEVQTASLAAIDAQLEALNELESTQLAAIDAQLKALQEAETAQLAAIDQQIAALNAAETAQLTAIDAQIAQANADAQKQIAEFQELAAQGLEAIRLQALVLNEQLLAQQAAAQAQLAQLLGDKTLEQFMAEKQAEAAELLRGIDRTLQEYLGTIITNLFPGAALPTMAEGGIVMPRPGGTIVRLAEAGYPEMVTPMRSGTSGGGQQIIFSPQITVHADSNTDGQKVGKAIVKEIKEAILYGELHGPVQRVAGRR